MRKGKARPAWRVPGRVPIDQDLLNPRKKRSPFPLVVALVAVLGAGAFALGRWSAHRAQPQPAAPAAMAPPAPVPPPVAVAPAPAPPPPPDGALLPGTNLRRAAARLEGTLDESLAAVVGPEQGPPLTQVATRLLVWWLDMARDVRAGDSIELVYELPEGEEPVVHALRYDSGKLGKQVRAYRYQAPGSRFARYYDEAGTELEQRLVGGPVEDYEQVTSLLRDGRRHKGVDFKTPVGTPVHAPFAGVVKRRNWNFRGNGNSLEIEDAKGRRSLFLHLQSVERGVRPGTRVKAGQLVALSGNTGRSTAPHLHYQLMGAGDRVLDPFEVHATTRVSLAGEALTAYQGERDRLSALLAAHHSP